METGVGTIAQVAEGDGRTISVSYAPVSLKWRAVELGGPSEGSGTSAAAALASALEVSEPELPAWAHNLADHVEQQLEQATRYACPCCGFMTLFGREQWVGCPVCRWEDEPRLEVDPNRHSALNGLTLTQARANYAAFGAVSERKRRNARHPTEVEQTTR